MAEQNEKKQSRTLIVEISAAMEEAIMHIVKVDTHQTKSEFVRDAIRRQLEAFKKDESG